MREIRFRAWDTKNKVMESPASWLLLTQAGTVYVSGPMSAPHPATRGQYIVQFFTGLTNNGQDWYDGDILENDSDWYQIIWDEEQAQWRAEGIASTQECIALSELLSSETWVQGNIYENPELLESDASNDRITNE